jgi:hypothetical protein
MQPVVLGEQITPVVVAVGQPHDGVDVVAGGLRVAEEDARVVVVLDQQDGGLDAVVEGGLVVMAAAPGEPRLAEVLADQGEGALRILLRQPVGPSRNSVSRSASRPRRNASAISVSSPNASTPSNRPVSVVGSAPRKTGARTTCPPTKTQCRSTWWPISCQPHGSRAEGVPKTVNQ